MLADLGKVVNPEDSLLAIVVEEFPSQVAVDVLVRDKLLTVLQITNVGQEGLGQGLNDVGLSNLGLSFNQDDGGFIALLGS